MSNQVINPSRMELTRLKNQLGTTRRGHHLLKDKQDEMIRQFMLTHQDYKNLRAEVEGSLFGVLKTLKNATASSLDFEFNEMMMVPAKKLEIDYQKNTIMSVNVPKLKLKESNVNLTFSLINSDQSLDLSVINLGNLLSKIILLAEQDKTVRILLDEISKTRRRVNAIENIMIPELLDNIKIVKTKINEIEMSNTIRIMKSKEIILKNLKDKQT